MELVLQERYQDNRPTVQPFFKFLQGTQLIPFTGAREIEMSDLQKLSTRDRLAIIAERLRREPMFDPTTQNSVRYQVSDGEAGGGMRDAFLIDVVRNFRLGKRRIRLAEVLPRRTLRNTNIDHSERVARLQGLRRLVRWHVELTPMQREHWEDLTFNWPGMICSLEPALSGNNSCLTCSCAFWHVRPTSASSCERDSCGR